MNCDSLIEKVEKTHALCKEEIVFLLREQACQTRLMAAADRTRRLFVGDEVHLRGLIEFSNICRQNCLYCGLRRDNAKAERYRLSAEEVFAFAEKAKACGYRTIVMQSGEDALFSVEAMTTILRRIKTLGMAITLSCGEKTYEEYKAYKEAGADRYLLRIETTDASLYGRLHPGMSFENRLLCLRDLKALGYEVGTGCLIGLPGQTMASLAEDLLFFKRIDADMIGVGPFIPNGDTPLRDAVGGDLALSLRFIALLRLLLPDINIPATTALETLDPEARITALQAGANVVMPNVTEGDYQRKYSLYPGKAGMMETPQQCRDRLGDRVLAIRRTISNGQGYRKK